MVEPVSATSSPTALTATQAVQEVHVSAEKPVTAATSASNAIALVPEPMEKRSPVPTDVTRSTAGDLVLRNNTTSTASKSELNQIIENCTNSLAKKETAPTDPIWETYHPTRKEAWGVFDTSMKVPSFACGVLVGDNSGIFQVSTDKKATLFLSMTQSNYASWKEQHDKDTLPHKDARFRTKLKPHESSAILKHMRRVKIEYPYVYHPDALSILCTLMNDNWVSTYSQSSGSTKKQERINVGDVEIVLLPPLPRKLGRRLCQLGHSETFSPRPNMTTNKLNQMWGKVGTLRTVTCSDPIIEEFKLSHEMFLEYAPPDALRGKLNGFTNMAALFQSRVGLRWNHLDHTRWKEIHTIESPMDDDPPRSSSSTNSTAQSSTATAATPKVKPRAGLKSIDKLKQVSSKSKTIVKGGPKPTARAPSKALCKPASKTGPKAAPKAALKAAPKAAPKAGAKPPPRPVSTESSKAPTPASKKAATKAPVTESSDTESSESESEDGGELHRSLAKTPSASVPKALITEKRTNGTASTSKSAKRKVSIKNSKGNESPQSSGPDDVSSAGNSSEESDSDSVSDSDSESEKASPKRSKVSATGYKAAVPVATKAATTAATPVTNLQEMVAPICDRIHEWQTKSTMSISSDTHERISKDVALLAGGKSDIGILSAALSIIDQLLVTVRERGENLDAGNNLTAVQLARLHELTTNTHEFGNGTMEGVQAAIESSKNMTASLEKVLSSGTRVLKTNMVVLQSFARANNATVSAVETETETEKSAADA